MKVLKSNDKMKYVKVCVCYFLFFISSCVTDGKHKETKQSAMAESNQQQKNDEITKITDDQLDDWNNINYAVLRTCVHPYLAKSKKAANCTSCKELFLNYIFLVDKTGNVTDIKKKDQVINCNLTNQEIEELDSIIKEYFKKQILAPSLRNHRFIASIGFLLPC